RRRASHRGGDRQRAFGDLPRRQAHHGQLVSYRGCDRGRYHGAPVRPGPDAGRLEPAAPRHQLGGPGPQGGWDRGHAAQAGEPTGDQGGGALAGVPGGAGTPAALSTPGSSPSAATRAPSSRTSTNAALGSSLPVSTTSSLSVYLVLVVGAAVAFSATFLFRTF